MISCLLLILMDCALLFSLIGMCLMPWVGQCLGVSAWAFPLIKVYRFYYFYRCKVTTYMYNMQTFSTLFYFRHRIVTRMKRPPSRTGRG